MFLLFTESHQDDGDEKVQHHKGHEHDAGANEEPTQYWIKIQNLDLKNYSDHQPKNILSQTPQ